jgi:PAS domain S-box-containing protein
MTNRLLTDLMTFVNATFPVVGLKSALLLALFSSWVVAVVFAYLNLHTRQVCFRFWAVAWLWFSMYVAASIGLERRPDLTIFVILGRACIGVSALFTLWGDLHVAGRMQRNRDWELAFGSIVIFVWSFAAPHIVSNQFWSDIPAFLLLALAGAYVAILHVKYWKEYKGARVLTVSLSLWSLHLVAVPWEVYFAPGFKELGYLVLAALPAVIAMGAIMLVLEQARARNRALRDDLKKGLTERRMLEEEIGASEQKYRLLFDSAGDAIFLVDLASLEVLEANPAAAELAGCASEKLVKRSFLELCPKLRGRSARLLENKRFVEELFNEAGEFQMVRGQGEQVLCDGRPTLLYYHTRPVFQINAREISGRKRMEQQLRQAEKL